MPRSSRILLPDTAHHIVQRGHNRRSVFAVDADYTYYLANMIRFKKELGCEIYAYCLMTNHVHLVVNPGEKIEALSMLMKRVAGRQTRYANWRERRSGTLWDGRFKSSVIWTVECLAACCRYIELNPVRAGIVTDPADYKWSSYTCKISKKTDPAVDFSATYLALGSSSDERRKAYAEYVYETVPDAEIKLIREALQRGHPTQQPGQQNGDRF